MTAETPSDEILTYRAMIGNRYAADGGGDAPVMLTLIRVDALDRGNRPKRLRDPLSLFFLGPPNRVLGQDTYKLQPQQDGQAPLRQFLTCLGPAWRTFDDLPADQQDGMLYQSVMN